MTTEAEFLGQVNASDVDDTTADVNTDVDTGIDDNQDTAGDDLQLSPVEQKAYDQGWRPQEDFKGDEDSWKTAKEYVKDGEWLAKIKDLKGEINTIKTEADERVANNNRLNEGRRKSEIAALKKQQREAVELADADAYDDTQKQIEELESQDVAPTAPDKDPVISEWETANPWINDQNDERTAVAQGIFNNYTAQNKGATTAQALAHVDGKINKLYPADNTNSRREQPNVTENVDRKPARRNKELAMADLTASESAEYNLFGKSMFKDEKAFLKAVKDARVK